VAVRFSYRRGGDAVRRHVPGEQIMLHCAAVELLYQESSSASAEVWRARPLFVEGPEVTVTILETDECTPLHSHFTMHLEAAAYPLVSLFGSPVGEPLPAAGVVHGRNSSYTHGACRCRACRQAHAKVNVTYRLRCPRRSRRKLGLKVRASGPRSKVLASESAQRLRAFFARRS
jgi:hypothetical protein